MRPHYLPNIRCVPGRGVIRLAKAAPTSAKPHPRLMGDDEIAPDPDFFEAGVTIGSERTFVTLDGVPVRFPIRAHRGQGWVVSRIEGIAGRMQVDGAGRAKTHLQRGTISFGREW